MQKVTHVAKKRSDGSDSREKDHYCERGSDATGGRGGKRSHMSRKSEATEVIQERKITTAREGAKRPEAASCKRSRMSRKSEATEVFQERKITTAAEGAKRPEAASCKRSRLP